MVIFPVRFFGTRTCSTLGKDNFDAEDEATWNKSFVFDAGPAPAFKISRGIKEYTQDKVWRIKINTVGLELHK
jgi:hypothetical protein